MKNFSQIIQKWYHINHRQLPWRETTDPYKIWLSEIIMQQTQIVQGLSYYNKFVENFPNVKDLAEAELDHILHLWQGLGYYSRARNLHTASQQIMTDFSGKFPSNYKAIKSLKGVGDYTAAAIASFAYKLPHAVVDGNVYRFLSRCFGIKTPIDSSAGKKEFAQKAQDLLDINAPDIHNQAIMEFGALQCTPKKVNCENCPLVKQCEAYKLGQVSEFPVKEKKTKVRIRHFHFLKINFKDTVAIEKRPTGDIWAELYQFPLIETKTSTSLDELESSEEWQNIFEKSEISSIKKSNLVSHVLSHQKLKSYFYEITLSENNVDFTFVDKTKLKDFAFPQLIRNELF